MPHCAAIAPCMAKWLLALAWIVWIIKWQCQWESRDDILRLAYLTLGTPQAIDGPEVVCFNSCGCKVCQFKKLLCNLYFDDVESFSMSDDVVYYLCVVDLEKSLRKCAIFLSAYCLFQGRPKKHFGE
jgi:hypothetical protein